MSVQYTSPLHQTVTTTVTDYWNDSCAVEELTYALEHGAVGATTNPTIVLDVLKKESQYWRGQLQEMIQANPIASEDEIAWWLIEQMAMRSAKLLLPVFEREHHKKGRLSIQTNPTFYRNAEAIVEQAMHFNSLAPNIQAKIPVTHAGITAIEEATYRGVNINATVCFTVPQSLAVAEAVERGLKRRVAEGKHIDDMSPVCTIMIGRLDDWMQALIKRDAISCDPGCVHWAGIACIKKASGIYSERGYRTRLLAAAYRHHLHWSELIGGDVVLTIPYVWQRQFNASDIEVKERFANPVAQEIIDELHKYFPDFRRAYDVDGLRCEEFDTFGATVRTLRTFIASYRELIAYVRDVMLPDPEIRR
ncbi:MAG: transaldolase family protein [Chloroflexi bacterium]|nr:transaldolase family protein [Chloroflexota bacterium]